jgi:hypothetical protein
MKTSPLRGNPKSEIRNPKSRIRLRHWSSWPVFLLLCGQLIFCHGCHGEDVDDELCVPPHPPENSKSETVGEFSASDFEFRISDFEFRIFTAALASAAQWRKD